MSASEYPYAGLVLPEHKDLDPLPYLASAARVLARLDPIPEIHPSTRARGNKVFGQRYGIAVMPEEESDYGPKVVIELVTVDGELPDDERAARILSDAVLEMLSHSSADILEWYSPDVLLDRDDFIRLRSYVSPRRLQEVDEVIEDTLFQDERLASDLRESHSGDHSDEASVAQAHPRKAQDQGGSIGDRLAACKIQLEPQASPKRRYISAAGYLIAGVIGILSLPVGVFVFIVSLVRGVDFRLISQAIVVTALFTVLINAGRLGPFVNAVLH
jgi:hypothetical protein